MEKNVFAQTIIELRKARGMTQEALAQEMGVTAQAVSKWENGQSYPDVTLLPQLAEVFEVSIDALFGREAPVTAVAALPKAEEEGQGDSDWTVPPWEDDERTLHVVLFAGHRLIGNQELKQIPLRQKVEFQYEGPALNIVSDLSVSCDRVQGNVTAGGSVTCDDVGGHVSAQGSVNCDDVAGNVSANGGVNCDNVEGSVYAGGSIACDAIGGSATAGGRIIR